MVGMTACPTCGRDLSTIQRLRKHHKMSHDEPLPNRECVDCGDAFYDPKARRKYCGDCNPNAGENNGNWKNARESTTCQVCDAEFEYYPSNKKGIYCADCVESSDGLLPEQYATRIDRIVKKCLFCSAELRVLPSQAAKKSEASFVIWIAMDLGSRTMW